MADQRAGEEPMRLTWEQVPWIWSRVYEWRSIYHDEKGEYPDLNNTANMSKSCLLGRMLVEGKDPLPEPPPVCCAAPWYAYVEQTGDVTHNRHHFIADLGAPVRCLDCDEPVLMAYWKEVVR